MRILSDIHGNFEHAHEACTVENVIQIGDLGIFTEEDLNHIPANMRFFAGNHDNYKAMAGHAGWLGRYGYIEPDVFFISGAYSIDKEDRIPGVSWWEYEELSWREANECLKMYNGCRVLLSHDTSTSIMKYFHITDNSFTRNLIREIIGISKPEINIFGHHHLNYEIEVDGVMYQCINKNTWIDI